jgi:hypothetical protein
MRRDEFLEGSKTGQQLEKTCGSGRKARQFRADAFIVFGCPRVSRRQPLQTGTGQEMDYLVNMMLNPGCPKCSKGAVSP